MYCKLVQWFATQALETGAAPATFVQWHLIRCPKCQQAAALQKRMHTALCRTPPAPSQPPAFLHARIMGAVHSEIKSPSASRWNIQKSLITAGTSSVLLAVLIYALMPVSNDVVVQKSNPGTNPQYVERTIVTAMPKLDLDVLGIRLEEPFAQEASAIVSDARQAAKVLTASFIPSSWQRDASDR